MNDEIKIIYDESEFYDKTPESEYELSELLLPINVDDIEIKEIIDFIWEL